MGSERKVLPSDLHNIPNLQIPQVNNLDFLSQIYAILNHIGFINFFFRLISKENLTYCKKLGKGGLPKFSL